MMPKPFGYVSADFLRRSAQKIGYIKKASYECMHLAAGGRVLDSGCGPGIDTVAMASLVPEGTEVIGIDIDESMLREADRHAENQGVQAKIRHILADAYDLPFEDGYFSACRAERLFQNIPANHDAGAVLREHLRVLSPGGRIVLLDTDLGTASVDFDDADLERRMIAYFATRLRPNGLIARKFYRMLKNSDVGDVEVQVFGIALTELDDSPFGSYLADAALRDGHIDEDEARRWIATLAERSKSREFFSCLNLYLVSGTKG